MEKENKSETSLILPITTEFVERRIYLIRGVKVLLDSDLAELYQVDTKRLNEQVKRNNDRFPVDFMFQLTKSETNNLKSQFATSSWGGKRKPPYAFTELGVAMLSSVLNSERAVQMNIYIMRAFVKLRKILIENAEIAKKIGELEKGQKKHTEHIIAISSTLKRLMDEGVNRKDAIGFIVDDN
ncbi:MAG TPA: ORF6N domain-containing protein [Candidatus Paceibacterota bacterium]